jgi:PAS domain S-box-containing protein
MMRKVFVLIPLWLLITLVLVLSFLLSRSLIPAWLGLMIQFLAICNLAALPFLFFRSASRDVVLGLIKSGSPAMAPMASKRMGYDFGSVIQALKEAFRVRDQRIVTLEQDEGRYRSLILASSQLIWTTGGDGLTMTDPIKWEQYTGMMPESSKGSWLEVVLSEQQEELQKDVYHASLQKKVLRKECLIRREDGMYRYFLISGFPVMERDGSVREWFYVGEDITDRKDAEHKVQIRNQDLHLAKERMQEEKAELEALIESIGEGIVMTDAGKGIRVVNRQAEEMFGMTQREMIGKPLDQVISFEKDESVARDKAANASDKELSRGRIVSERVIFKRSDGSKLPLAVTVSPMVVGGKMIGTIQVLRDMTKEKAMDEVKSEFVSTVSHEMRTPLTTIREGVSQVHEGILGAVNEDQKSFLQIAMDEVDRLGGIVDDLLDVSKIEAGKFRLRKSFTDLQELARRCVLAFESIAKKKKIKLQTEFTDEKLSIFADADRIKQVLTNLVSNAYKFTPEGGCITIRGEKQTNSVKLSVEDTGMGISKENVSKLFNKFVQFGRTPGAGAKGTGLGLAICKGLVELHKGKIWAESERGKGTKIAFTLPLLEGRDMSKEMISDQFQDAVDRESNLSCFVLEVENYEGISRLLGGRTAFDLLKGLEAEIRKLLDKRPSAALCEKGECIVLLPEAKKETAKEWETKIKEKVNEYVLAVTEKRGVRFDVKIGVSRYPEDVKTSDTMLRSARISLQPMTLGSAARRSERKDLKIQVQMNAEDGQQVDSQTVDVSEGGLCLTSKQGLMVGSTHDMLLELPESFGVVRTRGIVVWSRQEEGDTSFKIGLQFLKLKQESQKALHDYMQSNQGGAS